MTRFFLVICTLFIFINSNKTFALDGAPFVVEQIKIIGLKKIPQSTLLEYLAIKKGHEFDPAVSQDIINSLYETGFFEDIKLARQNSIVVITVKEHPTIASITFEGNKDISDDKLKEALTKFNLRKGDMYNPAKLDTIGKMLKMQYESKGKRDVAISTEVKSLSANRVKIIIYVDEGKTTIVDSIQFVGNQSFATSTLAKEMYISTPGLLTFFTEKDKYSKEKLDASLDAIKNYYLDHGYAKFEVLSSEVLPVNKIHKKKRYVKVLVTVSEGEVYHIKDYQFVGNLILTKDKLLSLVKFQKGDIFSKKRIIETISGINDELADKGYSYSSVVDVHPEFLESTKEIVINFLINPGRPVYVRQIAFTGNHQTGDYVLRRAFRQQEGSLLSQSKLQESERQIRLLGYIQDIQIEKKQVPETNDQVDLHVKVEEGIIADFMASVGYGTLGAEFNVGINNHNIFGTGTSGGFHFKKDAWGNNYTLSYYNPFYTKSGIGRGFNFYYQEHNISSVLSNLAITKLNITPYSTDRFGASMNYVVPFGDYHSLNCGVSLEHLRIKALTDQLYPTQLKGYKEHHGDIFNTFNFTAGWSKTTYDQLPYPTRGAKHSIDSSFSVPLNNIKNGLYFYKFGAREKIYFPLFKGFVFSFLTGAKYGNSIGKAHLLPFYESFFAGGLNTEGAVKGFETSSLGPQDSNGKPMGGNLLLYGSTAIILPSELTGNTIRVSLFLDAGNVYQETNQAYFKESKTSGTIRLSTGAAIEWRTPFGPLYFSLGFALNDKKGDKTEVPQFTIMHEL